MDIKLDIKNDWGYYFSGIPADRKEEQKEVEKIKAEWPRPHPFFEAYRSQEDLDRAKEGWTKTGKIYHLLNIDENGFPVTHEYPEYFDRENKFIVVKRFDQFDLRKVTPVTWQRDKDGFLYFEPSDSQHLLSDFIDRPTNLGVPHFDDKTLKEYFNEFVAKEMIVDQKYEKEPHVLTTEMANRNYTLKKENDGLKQANEALETENSKLKQANEALETEKIELERKIKELKEKLKESEQDVRKSNDRVERFKEAIEKTNILGLKKLKETARTL